MALFSFLKSKEEKEQLNLMNEQFAIISFKSDGTIIKANKKFLDTMGYKAHEIIAKI
jgi:methyl-accepting chemotaxis protein